MKNTTDDTIKKEEAEILFLQKTRRMLNETEENVACWSVDGKSFYILNQKAFQALVLEKHYQLTDYSLFFRQLDNYGFQKVPQHQSTVNFGIRLTLGRSLQFEHPMLRQNISPERILMKMLNRPHNCTFTSENYLRNLNMKTDADVFDVQNHPFLQQTLAAS